MAKYRVSDRHTSSHKHRRPDYTMETRNILTYKVILHGPTGFEFTFALLIAISNACQIREQGICPNIGNMPLVERQWNTPVKRRTRNGEVLQSALYKRNDLIATRFWTNKIRIFLVKLQQRLLEIRKLKEPIFFTACLLYWTLAIWANKFTFVIS